MDFLILGPIEVRNGAGRLAVGGKPLAVLAVLLLHPNEPVSVDRLALALWGEDAPGGAVKTVQMNVSRLRSVLGDADAVTTTPAGYCLRVRPGELDAERFEGLVEDARRALAAGQPESAAATLREALELWRGPALAEFELEPFAGAEIARLEEQRLTALELRLDADLAAGRHAEVVGELARLVHANPSREGLACQLMLALYRCGRQSEALEAYATTRGRLVEDLGIEPGPQLRELHEAILRQDVALDAEPTEAVLPAALDPTTAQPLVGRDDELSWLLARWEPAAAGDGALVALAGPRGAGKSRLVAELAHVVHRPGVAILHASGDGPADTILVALRRARDAARPTLLVVDDADRAGAGVRDELEKLAHELAGVPALVVACADGAPAFAPDTLALRGLDAGAVRTIAARYAPGRPAADVPAQWLLEASAGVPSRVHEAAAQWARREAVRHVGVFADRARAGRAELATVEDELASAVAEVQKTRRRSAPSRGGDAPVICPFKGLASFDVADERYFFGREELVNELVARLVGAPLLGIVGPSGSGKSSVLRAGLLPALAGGVLPASDTWAQAIMRPGRHPLNELAATLAHVQDAGRVVLAVDQFEELFTACDDEAERAEFVSELVQAARHADGRYVVVLALRADHYGRCAAYPELAELLAKTNVLVGAMSRDELRRAIEGPSQRAGLHVEPELAEELVDDVEREPGGLPLLSTTLLELWQHRDGRRLRRSAYAHSGGVHGAVARLAEEAFAQLDEPRQALARGVLMRLVGDGDRDRAERRRVPLEELEIDRDEDLARVVALLTDRRLLTVSAGSIELAHEALLREWPRLRAWIDDDRDGLRIQRSLGSAAEEWERLARDEGALLRGSRLTEAVEWRDARAPRLNERERSFLAAGEAAREHERTTRRRRIGLASAAAATALLAVTVVVVAAVFADRERDTAASRELASRASIVLPSDPGLALGIGMAAFERRDTPESQSVVRQATLADRARAIVRLSSAPVYRAVLSRDATRIAAAGEDGLVRIVAVDGASVQSVIAGHGGAALGAAFSPDGTRVATTSVDGTVATAELDGGASIVVQKLPPDVFAYSVEYHADGRWLLAAVNDGRIQLIGTEVIGAGERQVQTFARHEGIRLAAYEGDAVLSAGNDGFARLWNRAGSATMSFEHGGVILDADLSDDGTLLATAGEGGGVKIWNARSGALKHTLALGQAIFSVQFDGGAKHVLTAAEDGVVRVSDVRGGPVVAALPGHRDRAYDAGFLGEGGDIYSTGGDGTLRISTPVKAATLPAEGDDAPFAPSFSRDGKLVVSGHDSGRVRLWSPETASVRELPRLDGFSGATFSDDGGHVISWAGDGKGKVRLYDVGRRASSDVRVPTPTPKYAAAIAPKGGRVAVAAFGEQVAVQAPDGSARVKLPDHGQANWLAFSPDGSQLASASADGTVRTWNATSGAKAQVLRGGEGPMLHVAWSPDGDLLAGAGADGTIRVWRLPGGEPVVLYGHDGPVNSIAFNPDSDRIVSGGEDGEVRVWDVDGGISLVTPTSHDGSVTGVAFSPDGEQVASAAEDGLRVVSCEVCGPFTAALERARTRPDTELTGAERARLDVE